VYFSGVLEQFCRYKALQVIHFAMKNKKGTFRNAIWGKYSSRNKFCSDSVKIGQFTIIFLRTQLGFKPSFNCAQSMLDSRLI